MAKLGTRMPSTGSTYTTAGSIPNSENACGRAIWLGFAAGCPTAGSVVWYRGGSLIAGSAFLPISGCQATQVFGPFIIPQGVYASMVGGSAIYWIE